MGNTTSNEGAGDGTQTSTTAAQAVATGPEISAMYGDDNGANTTTATDNLQQQQQQQEQQQQQQQPQEQQQQEQQQLQQQEQQQLQQKQQQKQQKQQKHKHRYFQSTPFEEDWSPNVTSPRQQRQSPQRNISRSTTSSKRNGAPMSTSPRRPGTPQPSSNINPPQTMFLGTDADDQTAHTDLSLCLSPVQKSETNQHRDKRGRKNNVTDPRCRRSSQRLCSTSVDETAAKDRYAIEATLYDRDFHKANKQRREQRKQDARDIRSLQVESLMDKTNSGEKECRSTDAGEDSGTEVTTESIDDGKHNPVPQNDFAVNNYGITSNHQQENTDHTEKEGKEENRRHALSTPRVAELYQQHLHTTSHSEGEGIECVPQALQRTTEVASDIRMNVDRHRTRVERSRREGVRPKNEVTIKEIVIGMDPRPPPQRPSGDQTEMMSPSMNGTGEEISHATSPVLHTSSNMGALTPSTHARDGSTSILSSEKASTRYHQKLVHAGLRVVDTLPTSSNMGALTPSTDARDGGTSTLSREKASTRCHQKLVIAGVSVVDTADTADISTVEDSIRDKQKRRPPILVLPTPVDGSVWSGRRSMPHSISHIEGGSLDQTSAESQIEVLRTLGSIRPASATSDICGLDESASQICETTDSFAQPEESQTMDIQEDMNESRDPTTGRDFFVEAADFGARMLGLREEVIDERRDSGAGGSHREEPGKRVSFRRSGIKSADPDGMYCTTDDGAQDVEATHHKYDSILKFNAAPYYGAATESSGNRSRKQNRTSKPSLKAETNKANVDITDDDEFDMVFIRKYEKFFSDFLWLHPDIAGGDLELVENIRAAKLKKMLEVAIEAEVTLERELEDLKHENITSKYHGMLMEAGREKAAQDEQLHQELQTIQQATNVMEGRLVWQAISMSHSSAKKQQKLLKDLFDKETDPTDMLDLLPDLPVTQPIRDAVRAPSATDFSGDKETDLRQFQVDNAFLKAEVQLLENKVAGLEAVAKKHAWVESVFLRLDSMKMRELRGEFEKKLGVVF